LSQFGVNEIKQLLTESYHCASRTGRSLPNC